MARIAMEILDSHKMNVSSDGEKVLKKNLIKELSRSLYCNCYLYNNEGLEIHRKVKNKRQYSFSCHMVNVDNYVYLLYKSKKVPVEAIEKALDLSTGSLKLKSDAQLPYYHLKLSLPQKLAGLAKEEKEKTKSWNDKYKEAEDKKREEVAKIKEELENLKKEMEDKEKELRAKDSKITEMEKELEKLRKEKREEAKKEPEGITPKEAELTKVYDRLIRSLINIIDSRKTITM